MARVAVVISRYSISNSPSLVNLLDFLSDRYDVDLYIQRCSLTDCPVLSKGRIKRISVNHINYPFLRMQCHSRAYIHHIAVDPFGFVLCKRLFPESKPYYYSLELYMSYDHNMLYYPDSVKVMERKSIHEISGLIIQSEEKKGLFLEDYGLPGDLRTLILPVTYRGSSSRSKTRYLRERFGIPEGSRIALHLGGVAEWFSCSAIASAFVGLRDWVLVFHGVPVPRDAKRLNRLIKERNIDNVFINNELFDDFEQMGEMVTSADIGIAWYNDISIGFRTAGFSSGKIPAYMQYGLPIIAKKYHSTMEAIEKTGVGICVDNIDEIPAALQMICNDYDRFSENAARTFDDTYNFSLYTDKIDSFITS
jgi:hypothetical protein